VEEEKKRETTKKQVALGQSNLTNVTKRRGQSRAHTHIVSTAVVVAVVVVDIFFLFAATDIFACFNSLNP
jgi:hypothetical protein